MKLTNTKIIISGSTAEVWRYLDRSISYDFTVPKNQNKIREPIVVNNEESRLRKIESRKRSMHRAQSTLRRLINANAFKWKKLSDKSYLPIFVTLTFKENIQDTKIANGLFSQFIKYLNYQLGHKKESFLKYVVVTEFQKRGAIHYHAIFFNLPFKKENKKIFEKKWKHGFVQIKGIQYITNIGAYVCKYMVKEFGDSRLDGKKRYFSSRGLKKPIVIKKQNKALRILEQLPKELIKIKTEYKSSYSGKVEYLQFQVDKNESFSEFISNLDIFL